MLLLLDLQFCSNVHAVKYSSEVEMWQHVHRAAIQRTRKKMLWKWRMSFLGNHSGQYLASIWIAHCLKRNRYFRGWGLVYLECFTPTPAFSSLLQNLKNSFVSKENTSNAAAIGKPKFKKTNYLDSQCFQMGYAIYPFWTHQKLLDNPEVVSICSLCDCTIMFGLKSIKWGNASDSRCLFLEEFHFV